MLFVVEGGAGFPWWSSSTAVPVHMPSCTHTSVIVLSVLFSQFVLHLEGEQGAFFLKARKATLKRLHTEDVEEDSIKSGKFINHEVRSCRGKMCALLLACLSSSQMLDTVSFLGLSVPKLFLRTLCRVSS